MTETSSGQQQVLSTVADYTSALSSGALASSSELRLADRIRSGALSGNLVAKTLIMSLVMQADRLNRGCVRVSGRQTTSQTDVEDGVDATAVSQVGFALASCPWA